MNSELNEKELPRFCPLYQKQIECLSCYETGMVSEGIMPESLWPKEIDFTEAAIEMCMNCEYHVH